MTFQLYPVFSQLFSVDFYNLKAFYVTQFGGVFVEMPEEDDAYVFNDCLAITQYITQHLGEEATTYLLAIESLTFDHWQQAKQILKQAGSAGRTTKEGFIKDIVSTFVHKEVKTNYAIANLSVLPGLQPESLLLASYTLSTVRSFRQSRFFALEVGGRAIRHDRSITPNAVINKAISDE